MYENKFFETCIWYTCSKISSSKLTRYMVFIKDSISHFNDQLSVDFNLFRRTTILLIGYNHVLSLINAAASDVDVKDYLLCSNLHTVRGKILAG